MSLKILIIGSGGREHSIGLKLAKSPRKPSLYFAPGNAGTAEIGQNIPIKDSEIEKLLTFAIDTKIDMTIVGPETPLVDGIVDLFEQQNKVIIGPNKIAAQIEGSKEWAKNFMKKHNVPTAAYEVFTELSPAKTYILKTKQYPIVIKADGLAAGKGVTVAGNESEALRALSECFEDQKFGTAGHKVVIEEFLQGEEASIFAFCDGKTILPMSAAQDHKAIFDGDKGPNTGGMGAYCPAPIASQKVLDQVNKLVFERMQAGFIKDGITYKGILYAGLMINKSEDVSIVEFNCRFGDPETQVVLPRLKNDLIDVFEHIHAGTLNQVTLEWHDTHVVDVVLAAGGYPNDYEKGKEIHGLDTEFSANTHIVHAGTKQENTKVLSNGGRVLAVVSEGKTLKDAIETVYSDIKKIRFEGMYFRKDIGFKALG